AGEERPVSFLAWTTTPWTLAANAGLAVQGAADYALVEGPRSHGEDPRTQLYVLATERLEAVFGEDHGEVLGTVTGDELVGARYHPVLLGAAPDSADLSGAFRVVADEIVRLDDGTGIVHVAPAYGDLDGGRRHDLPTILSVDLTGKVIDEVRPVPADGRRDGPFDASVLKQRPTSPGPFAGAWFKDADD